MSLWPDDLEDTVDGTAPPTDRVVGPFAHRYEIRGLLGAGGMGAVYKAYDQKLDELVALKVLRPELCQPALIEQFRREVKLGRKVTHRNVARVFDLGEHLGTSFLTMELVQGESLARLLARAGTLAEPRVAAIADELCAGLSAAHAVGVVHRDLKPDNILIACDGRVVITDFGIAASLESLAAEGPGSFAGTPAYMAPEQVDRLSPIDARADLYALGVLLFECVTGKLPWQGETPLAMAVARLLGPPPDPRERAPVSEGLAQVVMRLMERRPASRYRSAAEVSHALGSLRLGSAAPPPSAPGAHPQARRRHVAVGVLAARPEDAEIASGLTQDLLDSLSSLAGLVVSAQPLAATASEAAQRARAREARADFLVRGDFQQLADGSCRLTLRALGVSDGVQIWAKRFERPSGELLAINDEAARALAEALTVEGVVRSRRLTDPTAIALYLKARARFRGLWAGSINDSIALLEAALQRAPDSPLLLAAYATTLARSYFFTGERSVEARRHALAALELSPDLAEAHLALAYLDLQMGSYERSAAAVSEAIARTPTLPEAHLLRGRLLAEVGAFEAAEQTLQTCLELDRAQWMALVERARMRALQRDLDGVDSALRDIRLAAAAGEAELSRAVNRIRLALWTRDPSQIELAVADVEAAAATNPTGGPQAISLELVRCARERRLFDVVATKHAVIGLRGSPRRHLFFEQMGCEVACFVGDYGRALVHLRGAIDYQLLDLAWLDGCPLLEPLRSDPSFAALREPVWERALAVKTLLLP